MAKTKVTISDIATTAGVSKTTVSRYINGQMELLSKPTAMRIRKAIELTGYSPSATARALSRGSMPEFAGLVVENLAAPGVADLVHHIAAQLREQGQDTLIIETTDDPDSIARTLKMLIAQNAMEVIAVGNIDVSETPVTIPALTLPAAVSMEEAAQKVNALLRERNRRD